MGLLEFFRRPAPIRSEEALADFIDANAAFLVQKGIYEYSRARAGHYAKVLFREPEFREAVEQSRWQAYPLGLAMLGEMVEGILRPYVGEHRRIVHEALTALVLSVFDRYPTPAPLGEIAWSEARRDLAQRVDRAGFRAPKLVKDIPEPFAQAYFALMPIHERLRGRDFATVRNYLRASLINIHDELSRRLDAAVVVQALRASALVKEL